MGFSTFPKLRVIDKSLMRHAYTPDPRLFGREVERVDSCDWRHGKLHWPESLQGQGNGHQRQWHNSTFLGHGQDIVVAKNPGCLLNIIKD